MPKPPKARNPKGGASHRLPPPPANRPPAAGFGSAVRGFGNGFMRFSTGVGRVVRPAVLPLAALGGSALLLNQAGKAADDLGELFHPSAQTTPIDTDGDKVPDSTVWFDPKTGRVNIFGIPPTTTQENDRQEVQKTTLWLVAGGTVAVVALLTLGRSK